MAKPTLLEHDFFPSATAGWENDTTWAEVSLDAVRQNVESLKGYADTAVIAVVKANGYGHGAIPVGRAALKAGASSLAVYQVEEGVVLRKAGISAPLLVFGPFTRVSAESMHAYGLTATVTSTESAALLQSVSAGRSIDVHVKVDTGLSRAGLPPQEAESLVEKLDRYPALRLRGLYTHFARADEACREPTLRQLDLLFQLADRLRARGAGVPMLHAANSAATLMVAEAHFDAVRIGISMYGYYPSPEVNRAVRLLPALRLHSRLSRVHRIATGSGVGYGHEFKAERPTTIGLVPVGYGDGLPRTLGHGRGRVIVAGSLAPIVGRISMDQITVDLTDIPGARPGDLVTLIGADGDRSQTADALATQAGTISYDILTGLLPRVPRLYVAGGVLSGAMRLDSGPRVVELEGE